jgi:fermentation-respiration switch protein FrsA (DUF1100 family)
MAYWIYGAVLVVIGGVLLRSLVGAFEARLVFFPTRGADRTPASFGLKYQQLHLTTSDGERLTAWQLEPERPSADIVYFHGNGGNLSLWLPVFAALHRLGYRVLAVDYRGYGLSTGSPSERGVYLDAEAAVRHAATGRSPGRPLVYWGRSLGVPIAASATRVLPPDGLVLESGFPDKAAVIRGHPILRALNVFSAYRFSTVGLLSDFRRPVLVLHGDRDSIVPFTLGRELFLRLSEPKQFRSVPGADHNDFLDESRADYWTPVQEFIARLRA